MECFAPATIEVGITYYRCPPTHQNQNAGSTFALPEYVDDESSSGGEDIQELEPENIVPDIHGGSKPAAIVDLTEGPHRVDVVDLTDKDGAASPAPQSEDLIDLTSPLRADSPDIGAEEVEDVDEDDLEALKATAMTLDNLMDDSDKDISDVESHSSQDSDDSDRSVNLGEEDMDSTESEASDEIENVGSNCSDDDEGSNSESEKADWDAEYSSDDDVLDHGKLTELDTCELFLRLLTPRHQMIQIQLVGRFRKNDRIRTCQAALTMAASTKPRSIWHRKTGWRSVVTCLPLTTIVFTTHAHSEARTIRPTTQ